MKISNTPVHDLALSHNLNIFTPDKFTPADIEVIASLHPDFIVVASYGLILPKALLATPKFGCLNIHPSLLPRWRGASPIQSTILHGDKTTGVAIMLMDAGIDTGAILKQVTVPVPQNATTSSLTQELSALGGALLLEVITDYCRGQITPQTQSAQGVTYAARLTKADGELLWRLSAQELDCITRACNPWPGAWFSVASLLHEKVHRVLQDGKDDSAQVVSRLSQQSSVSQSSVSQSLTRPITIKVLQAKIERSAVQYPVGTLHQNGAISCGDGYDLFTPLSIVPPGKSAMSMTAFMHGLKNH